MMKKKIYVYLFLLMGIVLTSCEKSESDELDFITKSDDIIIHQDEGNENVSELYTSFEEAKSLSDLFMCSKMNEGQMRTKSRLSDMKIKGTSTIQSKSDSKALMYVFNYTDGFTIIGASKDMYPVLAYSESGSFEEDPSNIGLSIWLDCMKEEIDISLKKPASVDDQMALKNYESLERMYAMHAGEKIEDITTRSVQCFDEIRFYEKVGPVVTTEWRQGSPYNGQSPWVDGVRAPAGCVPIAVAQTVNYHQRLTNENINWNKIANGDGNAIADLVYTIGCNVEMNYEKDYAHPKINFPDFFNYRDRVKNFLNNNGYNARWVDFTNLTFACPSIVEGFSENFIGGTNWFGGHWWVLSGYEKYEIWKGCAEVALQSIPENSSGQEGNQVIQSRAANYEPLRVWGILKFYFNWGWGGTNNGWYGCSSSYLDYSKKLKNLQIFKK